MAKLNPLNFVEKSDRLLACNSKNATRSNDASEHIRESSFDREKQSYTLSKRI